MQQQQQQQTLQQQQQTFQQQQDLQQPQHQHLQQQQQLTFQQQQQQDFQQEIQQNFQQQNLQQQRTNSDKLNNNDNNNNDGKNMSGSGFMIKVRQMKAPEVYKPILIVMMMSVIQQFSGMSILRAYVVKIFNNIFEDEQEVSNKTIIRMRKFHYLTYNWNVLFLSLFYIHNKFVAII